MGEPKASKKSEKKSDKKQKSKKELRRVAAAPALVPLVAATELGRPGRGSNASATPDARHLLLFSMHTSLSGH